MIRIIIKRHSDS